MRLSRRVACVVLLTLAPGCSLLFVKGPPGDYRPQPAPTTPVDCTESVAGPVLDGLMTLAGVLTFIGGLEMANQDCSNTFFCVRSAGSPTMGVGVGMAALWGVSTLIGANRVANCRAAKECERGEEGACQRFTPEPVPSAGLRYMPAELPLQVCVERTDCSAGAVCFDGYCRSR